MSRVRTDEVHRWLEQAAAERLPLAEEVSRPTPRLSSGAPALVQRNPDVYLEDDPDEPHTD